MSQQCQNRTPAPKQKALLFDHFVDALVCIGNGKVASRIYKGQESALAAVRACFSSLSLRWRWDRATYPRRA
jgi:hypothetical protein